MTRMDCKAAQELLHDCVAGETPPDERTRLEGHLAGCASCDQAFRSWQQVRATVRRAGQGVPVPPGLRASVMEKVREAATPARPLAARWLGARVLAPALAAVVMIALAIPLVLNRPTPEPTGVAGSPSIASPVLAVTPRSLGAVSGLLASLVSDHRMHAEMAKTPAPAAQQDRAIQDYAKLLASPVRVPQSLSEGYRREQCLLCPVGTAQVPHVEYRLGDRTVSLFLAPAGTVTVDGRKASTLADGSLYAGAASGENLLVWRSGNTVYALVSKESSDTLMQLAATF